jgi:hypothetical protein
VKKCGAKRHDSLIGAYIMWVLMLFYLSSGNVSVAMHDFASQAACEHAREVSQGMQSELPGLGRIRPVCVPKQ